LVPEKKTKEKFPKFILFAHNLMKKMVVKKNPFLHSPISWPKKRNLKEIPKPILLAPKLDEKCQV
jgi:hypothetical protein